MELDPAFLDTAVRRWQAPERLPIREDQLRVRR
jgi:hypothetical protein